MGKEKHPVDGFFKEALQGHQVTPSGEGRQRFLKEASAIAGKRRRFSLRWLMILAGVAFISVSALLVYRYTTEPSGEEEFLKEKSSNGKQKPDREKVKEANIETGNEAGMETVNETEAETNATTNTGAETLPEAYKEPEYTTEVNTDRLPEATPPAQKEKPKISIDEDQAPVEETVKNTGEKPVETEAILEVQSPDLQLSEMPDTLMADSLKVNAADVLQPTRKKPANRKWDIALSLHYTPEWMFNTLEGDKYVNNFGIEGTFRFGRYSIRTGAGLSITEGTNELLVEYNDYLGSFNQLDSMTFMWDEKHYHLLPTYFMSNQDVWDSLMRLDYPKVTKRYTYLQIPLILGYDVLQKNWITLGFRAGPILSILMKSKQLSGNYDPGQDKVIRINQITPDRIQTNWQVLGAINASFYLSRRISLELEPNIRYYFNSVYEKSDVTKKPWSAGFRTAITFTF